MITCPSCGSELRPPASAECPVCLAELPDDVRQAITARADAEARALAAEQAQVAAVAAQAAAQQAAAQQAAAQQAAQAQATQATNNLGLPPPPPPLYPPPMPGAFTGGPAPASGYFTGGPAPTFAPSPWAPGGVPASPSIPLRPGAPPTVPLSTYGAPQYAPQPGTIPNYGPPAQPVGYRVGVIQQNSGLATASLVLGILAMFGLCSVYLAFVPGLPAVICGHQALNRIKFSGGTLGGRGMAIAGLVMGYIALGISVIAFCAYMNSPH